MRDLPTSDPSVAGPLDRPTAERLLARGDELLAAGDYASALAHYGRVIGFPDASVTAAAYLGSGEALYRVDRDDEALAAWETVTRLPETSATYPAWRQIAAARVRAGEPRRALEAYRAAERLAPPADRAEIASRLGWLSKELGDSRSAGRYFARSRGNVAIPYVSYAILGITVVTWFVTLQPEAVDLYLLLGLDKARLAAGEWWRLLTPVLVHDRQMPLHILFNMYFLYLVGPLVEQLYGSPRFLLMYLLTAASGSMASYLMGPVFGVGASGAIFGLCGVLLAVSRVHRPILDRRGRALMSQIGTLVVVNLVIGFGLLGGYVDNAAHVGGLLAGLWLGFVLPPVRATTLASYWQVPGRPGGAGNPPPSGGDARLVGAARALGVVALAAAIAAGVLVGRGAYGRTGFDPAPDPSSAAAAPPASGAVIIQP